MSDLDWPELSVSQATPLSTCWTITTTTRYYITHTIMLQVAVMFSPGLVLSTKCFIKSSKCNEDQVINSLLQLICQWHLWLLCYREKRPQGQRKAIQQPRGDWPTDEIAKTVGKQKTFSDCHVVGIKSELLWFVCVYILTGRKSWCRKREFWGVWRKQQWWGVWGEWGGNVLLH